MKKVVNSVLASALALTVAPMAFAAEETTNTEAPKMDTELQKVVGRLAALNLVSGYGNGEYGVDRPINRAEFATLMVRLKNMSEGAKLAQYQSIFTDVKPSDWFSGYVNVASGQEIVKGYPDKTFRPGNNVTYAEAVTMIVRVLGYEPAVKGVWPNNMIAEAAKLNIAKNIAAPNNAATRGDIFRMMDNALRVKLMEQVEFGTDIRFEVKDETLLTKYLDVDVYDMEWARDSKGELPIVSNVPVIGLGSLKANEIILSGKDAGMGSKGTTFKVADGINPNEFAGQHVQVWIKDDKENTVVWMEGSEDEDVVMDRLGTFYLNDKSKFKVDDISKTSDLNDLEIELDGSGKTYRFTEDTKVTFNFQPYDSNVKGIKEIIKANENYTFSAKVVLDKDNKISYIHVIDDQSLNQNKEGYKYGSEVIKKIDADKKRIENLDGGNFNALKDLEEGVDFLVFRDNKPAKLADLKEMDVYSVYYANGNKKKLLVFANSTVVEGKVERVIVRNDGDNRLEIDGKTYRFRTGSTYSDNANKDVEELNSSNWDLVRDLRGEEVKLYLDASGRIRHIETKDSVDDRRFKAIVTRKAEYNKGKYEFGIINENGKELDITIDAEDVYKADGESYEDDPDQIEEDFVPSKTDIMLLEVTLDSKGEAEKVKVLPIKLKQLKDKAWNDAADEDDETIKDEDGLYTVTSDTAIFDMTDNITTGRRPELKNPGVVKFSDIADKNGLDVYYAVDEEEEEVDAIFVVAGKGLGSKTMYGLVTQMGGRSDNDEIEVITKDGETGKVTTKTFKLDDDLEELLDNNINRGDFIAFRLNSSDEVIVKDVVEVVDSAQDIDGADFFGDGNYKPATDKELEKADLHALTVARVDKKDGSNKFYFDYAEGKRATFTLNSKTAFINAYDMEEGDGVDVGDYVILVETDDDGNIWDYVIKVSSEDDAKRDYDDDELEDYLTNFFKQFAGGKVDPEDPEDPVDPVDLLDEESVEVVVTDVLPGVLSSYKVSGTAAPGATVKVKVGTREGQATADDNGDFEVTVLGKVGETEVVITSTKDGKSEEYTHKISK
ncbi:S-layer homology domain-containing protein [Brevibacillus sp. NL20B1]|jgi:Cu/Ag efflux protein CusF|uniref:S-layer homology domain-containing protein n=1 Tax=Brevibacillus sp. NL20B1 TaxID=2829799 RepID=UPI001B9EA921|nr:S-layer homology domain-containing protein [Brevibacillus sp. NL20B1]MBR8659700.1 S-layer homology domain-containing protein [Brevibacillus sp. NL20B1]